jgi:hypothetical protein
MLERNATTPVQQGQQDPKEDPPSRILPPPEQPPPFIEPNRKDPRRIDDPPRDPNAPSPDGPEIKPPGRDMPFIESAQLSSGTWHVQHYRALERRQTRTPHLLRVDTWQPLGFRIERPTRGGHACARTRARRI